MIILIITFFILTITGYYLYFKSKNRKVAKYGFIGGFIFSMCFTNSMSFLNIKEEWVEKPVSIIHNDRIIAVDCGEKLWELELSDKSTILDKNTKFYFEETMNCWGSEDVESIKMVLEKSN